MQLQRRSVPPSARTLAAAVAAFAALAALAAPVTLRAQCNSFPDGGTLAGVINSYYAGAVGTSAAGSSFVTVDTVYGVRPVGATAIAAGDLLLVMQMQDATINNTNTSSYGDGVAGDPGSGSTALNNSGRFEYVFAVSGIGGSAGICGAAAGRICVLGAGAGNGLLNTYTTAAPDDFGLTRNGQRTYQVIRVRQYRTATLGSTLTAYPWDGRAGGVLAFDVNSALALGGATVAVNGLGFRGGLGQQLTGDGDPTGTDYRSSVTDTTHANKGEGIAGTPILLGGVPGGSGTNGYPFGERARGAPGNAGGGGTDSNPDANDENSGGGGGGNGGAGGQGGNTWLSNLARGGHGGVAFPAALGAGARIVMGGGGGGGTRNNSPLIANASGGGAGGGIVLIRTGSVTGSGTLRADGGVGVVPLNDGGGGGGAGGTVVVLVETGNQDGLVVTARGGNGADAWPTEPPAGFPGERHGPGGGGGGGRVFLTFNPTTAPDVSGGIRGVTTTAADPYNATSGAGGLVSVGFVPIDTPGVQTCLVATRASIQGLRVLPGSVEFAVASQRRTRGFNVYAEAKGRRLRLNDALLESPAPDSSAPLLYRAVVGSYDAERLWIEEVETSGRTRWLGPFAPDDGALREAYGTVEARLEGLPAGESGARGALARRRVAPERGPAKGPAPAGRAELSRAGLPALGSRWPSALRPADPPQPGALKLEVPGEGTVDVAFADLIAAGMPPELASDPQWLRLAHLGRAVPFSVTATGLRFQSEAFESDYTGRSVYVLAWGPLKLRPPVVSFTRSGPALPAGAVRVEQDLLYAPFLARESDPWIWDVLAHGLPAGPYAFDLPGLGPGEALVPLWLHLAGATEHTHTVAAELNGLPLGELVFTGRAAAELKAVVPRAALLAAGNLLSLTYTASGGEEPPETGVAFLDALDLGVTLPAATGAVVLARIAAFDVTVDVPADTDYLIVSHADFLAQAQRLAALKSAEGRHALVVGVERAYDRYASGVFEAAAVRELLRDVSRRAPLRDVVLFGDDTFDPRGHLGAGLVSYVPSLDGWDGEFGRVASENLYADLDGDGRPELGIGRLPAQTLEQATRLVDKIEGQGAMLAQLAGKQLFAADNSNPGDLSFRGAADRAAELLPFKPVFADIGSDGAAAARATLLAGLASGQQVTHYFGHGGPEVWADEGLLRASDADAFAGAGVETVLFTWTCEAQWYQYDWGASINEALLLVPDGGALAALGPTGISQPHRQVALAQGIYQRFLAGLPLGEAVRQAKTELLQADPEAGPVVEGWSLLGDPALTLPAPVSRRPHKGVR